MMRARPAKPRIYEAFVISEENSLDAALDAIGIGGMLAQRHSTKRSGSAIAVAADGAIPRGLLSYLRSRGAGRITVIPLTLQQGLSESRDCAQAELERQAEISPALALNASWAESKIRIVVSRVKTNRSGAYSLCGEALNSCLSRGDLSALLDHYPAHCSIVADPLCDTPAVVANHPLLADWIGAMLMGRDPHSAPADAEWFRRGLLPRIYRVHGRMTPVRSWRNPPSHQQDLPHTVCGNAAASQWGQSPAEAAAAWIAYAQSILAPLFPSRSGARDERSMHPMLVERIAASVSSESLGELLEALLKGLGLLIRCHPALKEEIRTLQASYRLTTRDQRMHVVARFSNGVLTASRCDSGPVNAVLIFKDASALLQLAAAPKPDLLGAMLKQQIGIDGNLNYLLKLAYLLRRILIIVQGDWRRAA